MDGFGCDSRGTRESEYMKREKPKLQRSKLYKRGTIANFFLEDEKPQAIKVSKFVYGLLSAERWCRTDDKLRNQVLIVKEVLFSGDANKMVAELTQVRVDELAAPLPRPDPLLFLEPA